MISFNVCTRHIFHSLSRSPCISPLTIITNIINSISVQPHSSMHSTLIAKNYHNCFPMSAIVSYIMSLLLLDIVCISEGRELFCPFYIFTFTTIPSYIISEKCCTGIDTLAIFHSFKLSDAPACNIHTQMIFHAIITKTIRMAAS